MWFSLTIQYLNNFNITTHTNTFLYCIVLYCIVLYCIVLYCIVLYRTVPYRTVLYCIVLYCISWRKGNIKQCQCLIISTCSWKELALLPKSVLGEKRRLDSRERWKLAAKQCLDRGLVVSSPRRYRGPKRVILFVTLLQFWIITLGGTSPRLLLKQSFRGISRPPQHCMFGYFPGLLHFNFKRQLLALFCFYSLLNTTITTITTSSLTTFLCKGSTTISTKSLSNWHYANVMPCANSHTA